MVIAAVIKEKHSETPDLLESALLFFTIFTSGLSSGEVLRNRALVAYILPAGTKAKRVLIQRPSGAQSVPKID